MSGCVVAGDQDLVTMHWYSVVVMIAVAQRIVFCSELDYCITTVKHLSLLCRPFTNEEEEEEEQRFPSNSSL